MKFIFIFSIILFSSTCLAYQCPQFKDFSQDKDNVWHLNKIPEAPEGTHWKHLTQGPWAPANHKLDYINVELTYGTYPERVHCYYGKNGNIFMGIALRVAQNQKPMPLPGANFDGDIPNECIVSAENCQFTIS